MKPVPLLALTLLAFTGCATQHQVRTPTPAPAFYVPTAVITEAPGMRPPNPYTLLASADEQDLFFPRAEKYLLGPQPLFQLSSATTYTYDAQNISAPRGFGFRYSWITRSSLSSP